MTPRRQTLPAVEPPTCRVRLPRFLPDLTPWVPPPAPFVAYSWTWPDCG